MQTSLFSIDTAPTEDKLTAATQPLTTPLHEAVLVAIDVETTGINPKRNSLTEISALVYQNGEEIDRFSSLVHPSEPIPEEIEAVTGISNAMVADAPPLAQVLGELSAFLGPAPILVGHNIAFDVGFLQEKFTQIGMAEMASRISLSRSLCTCVLARKLLPGLPSYQGVVIATALGILNPQAHRAEHDARMAAKMLYKLADKMDTADTHPLTLDDLLAHQGSLS